MSKAAMVLADINIFDRSFMEGFAGGLFADDKQFLETAMQHQQEKKGLFVYDLGDFADIVNNEEFNPDQFWVTYIHLSC